VSFSDAEGVLFDPAAVTVDEVRDGERRFVTIGLDALGRVVVVVYTFRGEALRLISARPATRSRGTSMKKAYDFSAGRRGAVLRPKGKTRITIHLDNDVLEAFRERADAEGRGYQTMINEVLRQSLATTSRPVSADTIRRIVREELKKVG